MKKILVFISFAVFAKSLHAKEMADGWYILKGMMDTVKCQIQIPKDLFLFDQVSIIDSLAKKITFKARNRELIAFEFKYQEDQYTYILKKDMKHPSASFYQDYNSSFCFLRLLVHGPKLNFYYSYSHSSGSGAYKWLGGSTINRIENYYIEDMTMNKVSVYSNKNYKDDIKEFLISDEHTLELFDRTVSSCEDIPRFVKDANNVN
jgi:hypothetical protein